MTIIKTVSTNSPEETIEMGARLGAGLDAGDFVALMGDLGAGKTMFVKGVAKGLGIEDYLYVNSPSFVILKEYKGNKNLYHFDVYRLSEEGFCDTLDYRRYFYGDGISVVEWADKITDELPEEYLEVGITYGEGMEREFNFRAVGERFEGIVGEI